MQPGQTAPICDFTPAKEFAIYTVKLPDGRVGYVEYASHKMREVAIAKSRLHTHTLTHRLPSNVSGEKRISCRANGPPAMFVEGPRTVGRNDPNDPASML
jgi:hypothetical protein